MENNECLFKAQLGASKVLERAHGDKADLVMMADKRYEVMISRLEHTAKSLPTLPMTKPAAPESM